MPRCATALLAATLACAALLPAAAEARNFPKTALRGTIAFGTNPPAISLNGSGALLAPGARIHGMDNMLKMTGALAGQRYVVDYTVESTGLVFEVWLLTTDEVAVNPWPTTPAQAAAWRFDPVAQVWIKP